MMIEDGYIEHLDEQNFVRYLVFKVQVSGLERTDHPTQPDIAEFTTESTELIMKFVDYAVALYNYFHNNEPVTFEQVWKSMEAIWHDDIENKRRRVLISP